MIDFILYLVKVNIAFIVLFLFYIIFLKNLTFYKLNRTWILGAMLFAFLIPHLNLGMSIYDNLLTSKFNLSNELNDSNLVEVQSLPLQNSLSFSMYEYLLVLYVLIAAVRLFYSFIQVFKVSKLKSKFKHVKQEGFNYYLQNNDAIPFSFFNNIFIPQNYYSSEYYKSVVEHEKVHARQYHSLDLLFVEFFKALMWFNPLVYFVQKELKIIHEYLVDDCLLKNNVNMKDYVELLIENSTNKLSPSWVNGFTNSELKKRVVMMTSNKSNNIKKLIYLGGLPIVVTLLFAFSNHKLSEDNVPSLRPVDDALSFPIVSGFGMRMHPIQKIKKLHKGIDIKAPIGTPIMATADGIVVKTELHEAYGKMVVIKHNDTYESLYAQMSKIDVKPGDLIMKGEKIGEVGNSGKSTGPHLHFEIEENGKKVNPELFIK